MELILYEVESSKSFCRIATETLVTLSLSEGTLGISEHAPRTAPEIRAVKAVKRTQNIFLAVSTMLKITIFKI